MTDGTPRANRRGVAGCLAFRFGFSRLQVERLRRDAIADFLEKECVFDCNERLTERKDTFDGKAPQQMIFGYFGQSPKTRARAVL